MNGLPVSVINNRKQTDAVTTNYANFSLVSVNDHVVNVSVMVESNYWHYPPNSDETFVVMEGVLLIDLESETIELLPGHGSGSCRQRLSTCHLLSYNNARS